MWPSKRPSAFIGNSRLTSAPSRIRENEVRTQVSGARSAQNDFGLMSSAVRQTPLTATLLPVPSSFGVFVASTVMRRFSPRCSIFTTLPTSSIIPVNIFATPPSSYIIPSIRIAEVTFQREIFAEAMQLETLHARRPAVESFVSYKWNCALAKNLRRVVEEHLVHLVRR